MSPPGIEFRQVAKRYGGAASAWAVDGIDLAVPRGQLVTLLGPSGCGKTTTLRMIAGLESPTRGQILIDGVDVTALGPADRPVSMVFQSYALFPHLSVIQNVRYGLEVSGVGTASATQRARQALESVGLTGLDERLPAELSGGQQQRVAVARSLVLEPSVLLFDEPLSNLDARLRRSMREEIRALQQRLALTVAYVTHDQGEALAVSDLIVVMEAGRIAQVGSPRELYERPRTAFVAGFMGEALRFPASVLPGGELALGPLRLPAAAGVSPGPVMLAVRPEAWEVMPEGTPVCDGPTQLAGTLRKHAYLGHSQELTVQTVLGDLFVVSPEPRRHWTVGARVVLRLDAQRVAVLHEPAG
jgi:iron(III) transport system ATP-binding protein